MVKNYNIRHIDMAGIQKRKYFFDSNLWLKILKPKLNPSNRDVKYLEFVEKFTKHPTHPKIVVITLVLSEVINRYLREVTYPIFCKKSNVINPDKSHYKE